MSSIGAIVYDCDGMLVHEERFSRRLEAFHNIPMDRTLSFFKNEFQECLIGKADLRTELEKSKAEWGWAGSVDELLEFWVAPEHNRIDERFHSVLDEQRARGIRVYLATNNEKYRSDNLIQARGLGAWFDGTFTSSALGAKKPDPEFYASVMRTIALEPSQVLFWDDDQGHIDAARALGLQAELYSDFEKFEERMKALL